MVAIKLILLMLCYQESSPTEVTSPADCGYHVSDGYICSVISVTNMTELTSHSNLITGHLSGSGSRL